MPVSVKCSCGKALMAPDGSEGKKVRCPGCNGIVPVPDLPPLVTEAVEDEADVSPPAGRRRGAADTLPSRKQPDSDPTSPPERPKKKGKSKLFLVTVFVLLPLSGCLLLCAGGGTGYYFFVIDTDWRATRELGEHEKYLPDDFKSIQSTNGNRMRSSSLIKDLLEPGTIGPYPTYTFNNTSYDIERQTFVHGPEGVDIFIFTTKKAVDVRATGMMSEASTPAGKHTVYGTGNSAMAFTESKTFLTGERDHLVKILTRDCSPNLGATMKNAMALVDFSKCHVSARVGPFVPTPEFANGVPAYMADVEATATETDFTSEFVEKRFFVFKDADSLEKRRSEVEEHLNKMVRKDFGGVPLDVSTSGTVLTLKFKLTRAEGKKSAGVGLMLMNPD